MSVPAWAFFALVSPGVATLAAWVLVLALVGGLWAWFQVVRLLLWAASRIRTNRRQESTSGRRAW